MRGIVPGNPAGQLAVPLYRLDSCACACRHARLELDDHVWRVLCRRAPALEAWTHVFAGAGRCSFLARARRCVRLRLRDVEMGHHPGPEVGALRMERHALVYSSCMRRWGEESVSVC